MTTVIKKYFKSLSVLTVGLAFGLTSCSDYFEQEVGSVKELNESITEESKMFLQLQDIFGVMQKAGDQAIFLTDTRMNVLETTQNAPTALQDIYKYNATNDNEYADPSCYYDVIRACNAYLQKMGAYHQSVNDPARGTMATSEIANDSFKALCSSALRIKLWAYYMLGRIYGEAYWFDDALTEKKDLNDASVFTYCDMKALSEKCINLLHSGITVDGIQIPADLTMQWYKWLDQTNGDAVKYRKWQYLTPPAMLLEAEFRSWRASYLDESAAQADWEWIRVNLLDFIYRLQTSPETEAVSIPGFELVVPDGGGDAKSVNESKTYIYQTNIPLQNGEKHDVHYDIFYAQGSVKNVWQVVSCIFYADEDNQRNRIVQYFCPEYPGTGYFLRPATYALDESEAGLFNSDDIRSMGQKMLMNTLGGQPALTKYYYSYNSDVAIRAHRYLNDGDGTRSNISSIQPNIVLFRGHDYHFLLAEAENHLGHWDQAQTILNQGVTNRFSEKMLPADDPLWDDQNRADGKHVTYYSWVTSAEYGDCGIVGAARGRLYTMPTYVSDGVFELNGQTITEMERRQYIDWCLAQEYSKEYVAEGKAYSYLCKMAERWSHADRGSSKAAVASKMADIIAPKYKGTGFDGQVRSSLQGKYFIDWNLQGMK